jgi:hypothetical protein
VEVFFASNSLICKVCAQIMDGIIIRLKKKVKRNDFIKMVLNYFISKNLSKNSEFENYTKAINTGDQNLISDLNLIEILFGTIKE